MWQTPGLCTCSPLASGLGVPLLTATTAAEKICVFYSVLLYLMSKLPKFHQLNSPPPHFCFLLNSRYMFFSMDNCNEFIYFYRLVMFSSLLGAACVHACGREWHFKVSWFWFSLIWLLLEDMLITNPQGSRVNPREKMTSNGCTGRD